MGLDKYGVDGQMDQLMLLNAPFKLGRAMSTISPFGGTHISWLRSTLYGLIIILPKKLVPYPFQQSYKEVPIILGEWFNSDPEAIIKEALKIGGGPNVSDAYTINGLPGPFYNCSAKHTFKLRVQTGKTYLLRIINAALNDELFFSIANHTLFSKIPL